VFRGRGIGYGHDPKLAQRGIGLHLDDDGLLAISGAVALFDVHHRGVLKDGGLGGELVRVGGGLERRLRARSEQQRREQEAEEGKAQKDSHEDVSCIADFARQSATAADSCAHLPTHVSATPPVQRNSCRNAQDQLDLLA
jgi:hypothetical protein